MHLGVTGLRGITPPPLSEALVVVLQDFEGISTTIYVSPPAVCVVLIHTFKRAKYLYDFVIHSKMLHEQKCQVFISWWLFISVWGGLSFMEAI